VNLGTVQVESMPAAASLGVSCPRHRRTSSGLGCRFAPPGQQPEATDRTKNTRIYICRAHTYSVSTLRSGVIFCTDQSENLDRHPEFARDSVADGQILLISPRRQPYRPKSRTVNAMRTRQREQVRTLQCSLSVKWGSKVWLKALTCVWHDMNDMCRVMWVYI
jgi:hypothetical protein